MVLLLAVSVTQLFINAFLSNLEWMSVSVKLITFSSQKKQALIENLVTQLE